MRVVFLEISITLHDKCYDMVMYYKFTLCANSISISNVVYIYKEKEFKESTKIINKNKSRFKFK